MVGDKTDRHLETKFDEAIVELKKSLLSLEANTTNEVALAMKFASDTHMPTDAIKRVQKALNRVNERLHVVDEARRELLKYRGVI